MNKFVKNTFAGMLILLSSLVAAPAIAQQTTPECVGPSLVVEMNNAIRVMNNIIGAPISLEKQLELDGVNAAVYFDRMTGQFVVFPFSINWCFVADLQPIILTPEQAFEIFNLEVPTE